MVLASCFVAVSFGAAPTGGRINSASAQNITGTWTGQMEEKKPDGTIAGRTPIYLRVVQQQSQLTGVIGGNENSASPIQQITQDGDNVSFTATMSHGDIQVHWTVELTVKDGTMSGKGHAIRSDGHQWDVDMKVTRDPNGKRGGS